MRALRTVAVVHRSLGLGLWLVFVIWFASGIVMTFAGFPYLSERERLARAPALRPEQVRALPPAAPMSDADELAIESLGERAIYRSIGPGGPVAAYADTGEPFSGLSTASAIELAERWLGSAPRVLERLEVVDQWTPQLETDLPLLRMSADDAEGTEIYVSLSRGEIVQKTTRRARLLAFIGAIPHWVYPIQLRRHAEAWRALVIILSALGAILSTSGLAHGLRALRAGRSSARGVALSLSPYRDRLLRFHHLVGLAFGLFTFTWALSGMLSLVSFGASSSAAPRSGDVLAFRGGPLAPARFFIDPHNALAACANAEETMVRRVELTRVGGRPFYVCHFASGATRALPGDQRSPPVPGIDRATISAAARALGEGAPVLAEEWLTTPDAYYYPTHFAPDLELPVLRTEFAGGLITYVAPGTGTVQRRYTRAARAHRWLYHGLHSLDLPALYRRERAWHLVIVVLAASGALVAGGGAALALRRGFARRRPGTASFRGRRSA